MLVLYVAIIAAPSSSHRIQAVFDPTQTITLVRDAQDRWVRTDEIGNQTYWSAKGGRIQIEDHAVKGETYDLTSHFDVGSIKDWSKPFKIRAVASNAVVSGDRQERSIAIQIAAEGKIDVVKILYGF